jgi:hypothetical protein
MKKVGHKLTKNIYYGMKEYRTKGGSEHFFKKKYNIIYLI